MNTICIQYYDAPCGKLVLGSHEERLCLCDWVNERRRSRMDTRIQRMLKAEYAVRQTDVVIKAITQLDEYFHKVRTTFDIPLLMVGTEFQEQVWQCLCTIPYGTTISYGEEARRIGKSSAARAVANANGANPISIFIPCHRVTGCNGELGGYAGGTDAKRYLLNIERPK